MNSNIEYRAVRSFNELTNEEVYDFSRLRCNIFIIEQGITQEEDLDGKDKECLHLLAYREDEIVGYLRILLNEKPNEIWIGRMVVAKKARRQGIAYNLVKRAVDYILADEELAQNSIELSAQCYAVDLYRKVGFETVGEPYDEVEIPHIHMTYQR